jgi:hypothetical protein
MGELLSLTDHTGFLAIFQSMLLAFQIIDDSLLKFTVCHLFVITGYQINIATWFF